MKLILTPEQMKRVDEYAIKRLRIPSMLLMENAGKAVVNEIAARNVHSIGSSKKQTASFDKIRMLVLCGKGNNGGDGFVVARLLREQGYSVTVVLIENERELSGDGLENYRRLQDYEIAGLQILSFDVFQKSKKRSFNIIVDAMLGTSFRGELKGKYRKAVEWCNKQSSWKIAVDTPTGLNGETGEVLTDAFHANVTVTMSNTKIGFYRERAKEYTGKVVIADIGIPKNVIPKKVLSTTSAFVTVLVEEKDVQKTFPRRESNSHKHSVGKIFILSGSKSMMGASLLCSQSAMRSGAGQVILAVPDSEYSTIAKRTIEVMPLGLPSTNAGSLSATGLHEIEKRISWSNVVLIGCGLSGNAETQELIREVIRKSEKPMVIDADGLNALAGNLRLLKNKRSNHIVITPHLGEFSRLVGISSKEIEQNKFSIAAAFAKKYNLILVLKGAPTITVHPSGKIFVNSTGNPGMSTAGSGDVLAGIIASLIGQGNTLLDASKNGVFTHGRSGDISSAHLGMHGMIASDMIKYLPSAISSIIGQ
jgi:hydroxyethylthiazole kinase-like uncharacterized protein yjeF